VAKEPQGDWKDFLAFTIAAYQLILPPVIAILLLMALLVFVLGRWVG